MGNLVCEETGLNATICVYEDKVVIKKKRTARGCIRKRNGCID